MATTNATLNHSLSELQKSIYKEIGRGTVTISDGASSSFETKIKRSLERGKSWSIEEADYIPLVKKPCTYCGLGLGNKGVRLDRIDNKVGYRLDNVVPCCGKCNLTRSTVLTHEEMIILGPHLRELWLARL